MRGSQTRYGPQMHDGPIQYAQAALIAKYPNGPPTKKPDNLVQLMKDVNDWVRQQPGYVPNNYNIGRSTVRRAWAALRDTNPDWKPK